MVAHVLLAQLLAEVRLGHEVVHVVVRVVVDEVAEDEAAEERVGGGVPKISVKAKKKSAASGIETAGGITRRSLSLGWSWWMPWMMKCMRRPKALSGSQWKTSRCSQYSVRVQIADPAEAEQDQLPGGVAAVGAEPLHRDDHRARRRSPGSRGGPGRRS